VQDWCKTGACTYLYRARLVLDTAFPGLGTDWEVICLGKIGNFARFFLDMRRLVFREVVDLYEFFPVYRISLDEAVRVKLA
jgi:hypothetical protein